MKFDLPKENSSIIKVLGIGGGGSNAVNHMFRQGINGVDFLVCNTDQQALDISPIPSKVQLGSTLTEGRGAGSLPEVGKNAAMENLDELKDIISSNTKMVFITAGMGGGTGTGAAPVIAKTAKEMGVLTVGIVTMPFFFEGKKRRQQAEEGIEEIRQNVDTLLIINNEKLREMCGNLPIAEAFALADDVLTTAAKGIAEIITRTGYINVDFEDVRTVMSDSGVAIMGSAAADGENRSIKAVEKALASPLLNDNNIEGARYVLLNIAFGDKEVLMDEISDITDHIQDEAGASADVIWGYGHDETLGDSLSVTIIATGFKQNPNVGVNLEKKAERRKINLEDSLPETPESTVHHLEEEVQPVTVPQPLTMVTETEEEATEDMEPMLKSEIVEETEENLDTKESVQETTPEDTDAEMQDEVIEEVEEEQVEMTDADDKTQRTFEFEIKSERREFSLESSQEEEANEEVSDEPFLKAESTDSSTTPISAESDTPKMFSLEGRSEEKAEEKEDWEPFKKEVPAEEASTEEATEEQTPQQLSNAPTPEEQNQRSSDRMTRLRDLSLRLRTPSGLSDLENEPAYKRKQINLDDVPHSSESTSSRFTLGGEEGDGEDKDSGTKLRPNNPFLHDNVD